MIERDPGPGDRALSTWALRYAGYGWSVIPVHSMAGGRCTCRRTTCPSVAKHPRIRWEHAMREAATEDEIVVWWERWPSANVGVVTGVISGVAVLDVDPRNGGDESLRRLEGRRGLLPVTPEVRTGGGGRHLWFCLNAPIPSSALADGIDVKAEGGMVVAPPSLHASGDRYVWRPGAAPDELAMATIPDWVTQIVSGVAAVGGVTPSEPPLRTTAEQEEFADAWERAGIMLERGDRYYLCPFHADHHPSLHIDAEGCRWYCFGCAQGGGIGRLRQLLGEHPDPHPRSRLRRRTGTARSTTLRGRREVDVVGESHHQDELLELTGGQRRYGGVDLEVVAELTPTPTNPYDPEAIEVHIEHRAIGHVRREDLGWIRPLVERSIERHGTATCRAAVRGGWDRGRGAVGRFGVVLYLPGR